MFTFFRIDRYTIVDFLQMIVYWTRVDRTVIGCSAVPVRCVLYNIYDLISSKYRKIYENTDHILTYGSFIK